MSTGKEAAKAGTMSELGKAAKRLDAEAIVFGGKYEVCDDYAQKEAILAKIDRAFLSGVTTLVGSQAARDVKRDGLRSLHRHVPSSRVALLENYVKRHVRDDLYRWAYAVGSETIGLPDPFYVDLLIVIRIHFPHVVAREGGEAEPVPFDWQERARMVGAGIRNPAIFLNQLTRRVRKRKKIADHRIGYDARSYHGLLPTLAQSHGPHIDTWYGHSYDGFNVWLSIDGVNEDNTVILYPELFGHEVDYDPKSMYLKAGIPLPRPTKFAMKPGQLLLFNPEMLHGTQVNISEETRVALTMRINPGVPRFNDNAPFNAEHWYSSVDLAKGRLDRMQLFAANRYEGKPSVVSVPVPSDARTDTLRLTDRPQGSELALAPSKALIEGHKLAIDGPGLKLFLVRTSDGVRAYHRACPHLGIDLKDGAHDDTHIYCPGHGIAFALNDGRSSCPAFALRELPVIERDGQILVCQPGPANAAEARATASVG